MNKKFDVIQVGLGPMGVILVKLILKRKNLKLKGIVDIDPQLIGKKLNTLLNIEDELDLVIESNLKSVLSKHKVDAVIIATSSSLEKVAPLIKSAVQSGSNVISICEELSYPFQNYANLSKELNTLAKLKDVTIVGTGINPGYLMDLLPIVITAPCQSVNSIKVTRMMNSAKRRVPFQKKIGTGLSVEEFQRKIREKEITGHVGLTQSIQMIVAAIGIEYDEIIELPPKEILVDEDLKTSYGELVPKGYVRGLQSKAFARKEGKEVITLDFVAYAGDHEEYDRIVIDGVPRIEQKIIGGVHGDLGTSAMVANLIPKVIEARPGLLTMKDLPVPCNTENIWKEENSL
ncbi:MAG: NAD(P)H-dependent amine dehydrogenase family protein [Promethearchaeota archaeon]|jgi:4-hydroxy-tetrahydrodipicolinate reductase